METEVATKTDRQRVLDVQSTISTLGSLSRHYERLANMSGPDTPMGQYFTGKGIAYHMAVDYLREAIA